MTDVGPRSIGTLGPRPLREGPGLPFHIRLETMSLHLPVAPVVDGGVVSTPDGPYDRPPDRLPHIPSPEVLSAVSCLAVSPDKITDETTHTLVPE